MVVNPSGRPCRCGARGCWETEVGEDAILAAAGQPAGAPAGRRRRRRQGRRAARAGLRRTGRWLGVGVANLVNLFNPDVVVFGGRLQHLLPYVEPEMRSVLHTGLRPSCEQVRLALARPRRRLHAARGCRARLRCRARRPDRQPDARSVQGPDGTRRP